MKNVFWVVGAAQHLKMVLDDSGQMLALRIEMAWRGPTMCATGLNEMPHVDRDRDDDGGIFGDVDSEDINNGNYFEWTNVCIEN